VLAIALAPPLLDIIDILYPVDGATLTASNCPPVPTLNGLCGGSYFSTKPGSIETNPTLVVEVSIVKLISI